jgi:serine/arginine repetitive matrix protein 2
MILETLSRIRGDNARVAGKAAGVSARPFMNAPDSELNERQSLRSMDSTISSAMPGSVTSSPGGRFTKRYSNNLFGSGRFRDETYLRSVQAQRTTSQRKTASVAPTESSFSIDGQASTYSNSVRPTTPEGSIPASSVQSTPEKVSLADSGSASYTELPISVPEYRLSKRAHRERASLALEEVIKAIEEEAEDEIVMPRSPPASRVPVRDRSPLAPETVCRLTHTLIKRVTFTICYDSRMTSRPPTSKLELRYLLTSKSFLTLKPVVALQCHMDDREQRLPRHDSLGIYLVCHGP